MKRRRSVINAKKMNLKTGGVVVVVESLIFGGRTLNL